MASELIAAGIVARQMPSGIANAVAIKVATSDSCRWVQVSSQHLTEPADRTVPACDSRSLEDEVDRVPEGPSAAWMIIGSPPAPTG